MGRTINSNQPVWKYIGKGSFTMKTGAMIKANQIFNAQEHEIPDAFRDVIILQNGKKKAGENPPDLPKFIKQQVSKGWFNVVDENGNILNEKKLREDSAIELIEQLKTM